MALSYRDENYWNTQKKKLFPRLKNIEFTCAQLAIPMYFPEFNALRYDPYLVTKGIDYFREQVDNVRTNLSSMLGCSSDQLFLFNNTTDSLREVLKNSPLREGDELLISTEEYGSMDASAEYECELRGALLRRVSLLQHTSFADVFSAKTRCLFLSHITHGTGRSLRVNDFVQYAKSFGIFTIIDGAQAVGQIPVNLREIDADAYVGCGHKWLHGETASGFAYVKKPEQMKYVLEANPFSLPTHLRTQQHEEVWWDMDGYGNSMALLHLNYSLLAVKNWSDAFDRIAYLGSIVKEKIKQIPSLFLLNSSAPGLIYIQPKNSSTEELVNELEQKHILVSNKKTSIRISVSPYNSLDDIARFEEVLRQLTRS